MTDEKQKEPQPWIIPVHENFPRYAFDYAFGINVECPDCHRVVFITGEEFEDVQEFNFCPICGKRRY